MTDVISLEDALDQMADALQRGAFGDLGALNSLIEAGIDSLAPMDTARAEGLRRRAARNAACLQAAARGVRAAVARIKGLHTGGASFSTYGADGRRVQVGHIGFSHSTRL
jgi:hypothetical protein